MRIIHPEPPGKRGSLSMIKNFCSGSKREGERTGTHRTSSDSEFTQILTLNDTPQSFVVPLDSARRPKISSRAFRWGEGEKDQKKNQQQTDGGIPSHPNRDDTYSLLIMSWQTREERKW